MTNTQLVFRIVLALHLVGVIVMAGTTLVDYFTFRTFCKLMDRGDPGAIGLLPVMSRFGALVRSGAVLIIFTGVCLLILCKDVYSEPWLKAKLVFVIGLVFHGMLVGNQQGMKFRSLIAQKDRLLLQQIATSRANLDRFYWIQLALFLVIILISLIGPAQRR